MRSSYERHGRAYRRIVGVSLAASAAIHAAVLGLGRMHVDVPGDRALEPRETPLSEPARVMQVVVIEPEAPPAPAQRAQAAVLREAAAGPGEAAPAEALSTASSDATDTDAAPFELPAIAPRAAPQSVALELETDGKPIAAGEVRATVPEVQVGAGEEDEEENGGGGLKGILDGIGGFLGGVKVSGGIGGGGGSGGKGGCVPGIGGIIGNRPGAPNIPQRPAVGPRGIGGRGPGRFEHRTGSGSTNGGCGSAG